MGNMICCTTIERLEETAEEEPRGNPPTVQGIIRELSSLTLFPNT
jgi:hypothetical protein